MLLLFNGMSTLFYRTYLRMNSLDPRLTSANALVNSPQFQVHCRLHQRFRGNGGVFFCWSAVYLICIMAAASVLRSNSRNIPRFTVLISRNLHYSLQNIKNNSTIALKENQFGRFYKMSTFSTSAKKSSWLDLSGVFPPIVTPFEDNEDVSYDKLKENFSKWNDNPFRGQIHVYLKTERKVTVQFSQTCSLISRGPRPWSFILPARKKIWQDFHTAP